MTLFRPVSACDTACVTVSDGSAARLRQIIRATLATLVLVSTALAGLAIGALPVAAQARIAPGLLRGTARRLLRVLGIRIVRTGADLPTARALVVANHVSWLDIIGMIAVADVRLLAKSDVATWPIIGRLARLSGAIFIDRNRPRRLPATIAEIRDALADGHVVGAFPEGTTTCGAHGVPYRPAVFQAALDSGAPVVPVTFRYRTPAGRPAPESAFIGDETLVTSLRRVLRMPSLQLRMHVSAALDAAPGTARGTLAATAAQSRGRASYTIAAGPR